jgi:hypothetical protein
MNRNAGNGNGNDSDPDEAAEQADRERRAQLRTAIIWFTPTTPLPSLGIPKDTQLGVHRALFPPFERAMDYLDALKGMQLPEEGKKVEVEGEERRLTLLMVAGGHFAGMVVGIKQRGPKDKQIVKGAGEVRILKSKTFHRYTSKPKFR